VYRLNIGLVIGTYGSIPYIDLHLKNAAELYPDIPILVHDDSSEDIIGINDLCVKYGADFSFNNKRMGHQRGDLFVFATGLLWAQRKRLDILVKMSRRWIPKRNWTDEVSILAQSSLATTMSSYCQDLRFFFRTECVALKVHRWMTVWNMIHEQSQKDPDGTLTEPFMYNLAKHIKPTMSDTTYEEWPLLGTSRYIKRDDVLWHAANTPEDYVDYARELGLKYEASDFIIE
jgi:hypothetical protein